MARVTKQGISTAKAVSPFNGRVVELAQKYAQQEITIRKAEEVLNEMKAQQSLTEKQLIELTELTDIKPPFRIEGLGTVSIVNMLSVTTADKDLLLHSLVAMGKEDLITQQVNMNTIKSFIQERLKADSKTKGARQLPQGLNITPYQQARFTKEREK